MTTDITELIDPFKIDNFEFTPTGFTAPSDTIDFDRWQRVGQFIRLTNAASQWWWGDWLNLGEDKFGEKASQALETTHWDENTLRVYAWVCRAVPVANRLKGVPFTHYQILAKLSPKMQLKWAKKIASEDWSRSQLKQALRAEDVSAESLQPCVLLRCKDHNQVNDVEAWAHKQGLDYDLCDRARKGKPLVEVLAE
jgi:hypothetical protein